MNKLPTVNIKELETLAIEQVYRDTPKIHYNTAAALLGMSERSLHRKLRQNPKLKEPSTWIVIEPEPVPVLSEECAIAKDLLLQIYEDIRDTGSIDPLSSIAVADYVNKYCIRKTTLI